MKQYNKARCPALSHSLLETSSKSVHMALLWVACFFSCSTSPPLPPLTPSDLIPPRSPPCHILSRVLLQVCRESNVFLVAARLNVRALRLVGSRSKAGRKASRSCVFDHHHVVSEVVTVVQWLHLHF